MQREKLNDHWDIVTNEKGMVPSSVRISTDKVILITISPQVLPHTSVDDRTMGFFREDGRMSAQHPFTIHLQPNGSVLVVHGLEEDGGTVARLERN